MVTKGADDGNQALRFQVVWDDNFLPVRAGGGHPAHRLATTAPRPSDPANMLAMPADLFPKNVVGSIWGIASMGSGFGGMAFALLTGWLVDRYSYIPVFAVFGLIPLIAVFIIWVFLGPLIPPYKVECPTTLG